MTPGRVWTVVLPAGPAAGTAASALRALSLTLTCTQPPGHCHYSWIATLSTVESVNIVSHTPLPSTPSLPAMAPLGPIGERMQSHALTPEWLKRDFVPSPSSAERPPRRLRVDSPCRALDRMQGDFSSSPRLPALAASSPSALADRIRMEFFSASAAWSSLCCCTLLCSSTSLRFISFCANLCVNQPVSRERRYSFTKSFLGDDAAMLTDSSGERPSRPRHRAGVASMA